MTSRLNQVLGLLAQKLIWACMRGRLTVLKTSPAFFPVESLNFPYRGLRKVGTCGSETVSAPPRRTILHKTSGYHLDFIVSPVRTDIALRGTRFAMHTRHLRILSTLQQVCSNDCGSHTSVGPFWA